MRINTNVTALNTYRQLSNANNASAKSMEKLSTGMRINRAADDTAGLAISEKMRNQIRGLEQASRNSQDGIALLQTAEGGINEVNSQLQRMRELVVQANNGTNTDQEKQAIQNEIKSLSDGITDTANRTEFNGQKLLNGSFGATVNTATAGTEVNGSATSKFTVEMAGAKVASDYTVTTGNGGQTLAEDSVDAVITGNLTAKGTWSNGGAGNSIVIKYDQAADTWHTSTDDGSTFSAAVTLAADKTFTLNGVTFDTSDLKGLENATTDSTWEIALANGQTTKASAENSWVQIESKSLGVSEKVTVADINDMKEGDTVNFDKLGFTVKVSDDGDGNKGESVTNLSSLSTNNTFSVSGNAVDLQTGANAGQQLGISLKGMTATDLGINNINVSSATFDFDTTINAIDTALKTVSDERSKIGAFQNRLEYTMNNLSATTENLTAAESRIRDVDMAKEVMTNSKNGILAQAAQAMLGQANQQPQAVLQLLR